MKKLLVFTSLIAIIALVACGGTTTTTTAGTTTTTTTTTTTETPGPGDTTAPLLELHKKTVEAVKGVDTFDAAANIKSAFDDVDGDITNKVQIDKGGYNGINTPVGEYTITYTLTDAAGNKSTETCTVKVVELIPSMVFGDLKYQMNFNPLINPQWSNPSGVKAWGYDLTKVTVYSKAYFEYMATNFPERVGALWSTIMITGEDLTVTYVRHHSSFGYYAKNGAVLQETSKDWCIGQPTAGNDNYCKINTGGLLANLVGENVSEYAKIPNNGYVFVFINDGPNAEGSPREFGDKIFNKTTGKFGVGEQLGLIGKPADMNNDNTPAYLKTAGDKVAVQAYYGKPQPNVLEGITAVSKKGTTGLQITSTIYPKAVSGDTFDFENPVTQFDMTGPAEVDGIKPATKYAVKYNVSENGFTDTLWRTYEIVDEKSIIANTKDFLTIGTYKTPVTFNQKEAIDKTETSGGFLMCSTYKSTAHLYDASTFLTTLQATKNKVDGFTASKNGQLQQSAYFVLDKNMKVVQFRFNITRDEIWTLGADGAWTKTDGPSPTGSDGDLFTAFLGESPLLTVPKDGFVLIAQNSDATYNPIIRQFGVNLFNQAGKFRSSEGAEFDQQELLKTTPIKMIQEGYSAAGELLTTKDYVVDQKVKLSSNPEKVYNIDVDHNWMWTGGEANNQGNTNLRFHAEVLHFISKAFAGTLDEKLAYLPNSSMVILDKNLKVVGVRIDAEYMDSENKKVYVRNYVTRNEAGENVVTSIDQIPAWDAAKDVSQDIHLVIPEGGYAFTIMVNSSFKESMLLELLGSLTALELKDVTISYVTTLKLA